MYVDERVKEDKGFYRLNETSDPDDDRSKGLERRTPHVVVFGGSMTSRG